MAVCRCCCWRLMVAVGRWALLVGVCGNVDACRSVNVAPMLFLSCHLCHLSQHSRSIGASSFLHRHFCAVSDATVDGRRWAMGVVGWGLWQWQRMPGLSMSLKCCSCPAIFAHLSQYPSISVQSGHRHFSIVISAWDCGSSIRQFCAGGKSDIVSAQTAWCRL